MAIISNGTTIASGGSVQGSGANLTNLPSSAPTNAQILSGVASASAGAVGSYALCRMESWAAESFGNTEAGSNISPVSAAFGSGESSGSTQSGTWRCMGSTVGSSGQEYNTTVWLRIS